MIDRPVIDRAPVVLPTLAGHDDDLWMTLVELTELQASDWTLIGGQMVFLHAMENGVSPPRVSTDFDVLVNDRLVSGGIQRFVLAIEGDRIPARWHFSGRVGAPVPETFGHDRRVGTRRTGTSHRSHDHTTGEDSAGPWRHPGTSQNRACSGTRRPVVWAGSRAVIAGGHCR